MSHSKSAPICVICGYNPTPASPTGGDDFSRRHYTCPIEEVRIKKLGVSFNSHLD